MSTIGGILLGEQALESFAEARLEFRGQPSFGRHDREPGFGGFLVHDLPVVAEDDLRRIPGFQRGSGDVPGLCHPVADEGVSEGILTPSAGDLSFDGGVVHRSRWISHGDDRTGFQPPWGQPCLEILGQRGQPPGCRLRLLSGNLNVAAVPFDVFPIKPANLGGPDPSEGPDGEEREKPGIRCQENPLHLIRGVDGDCLVGHLEGFALLGGRFPVGVEVALLLGEAEHGHDIPADGIPAHRPQPLKPGQKPIDVDGSDFVDVPTDAFVEPLEVDLAGPNVVVTHSTELARLDKFGCHLLDRLHGGQDRPVGGVEPDSIREGNVVSGGLAGARPFVHCGGQAHPELLSDLLAVAEQLQVAFGGLGPGGEPVLQPDTDLLGDQPGLIHAGEVLGPSPPVLAPVEGEHRVAVLAVDGVDLDSRGTCSDLHDAVAAFAFPGHTTRLSCQVCWNLCWRVRGRSLGIS